MSIGQLLLILAISMMAELADKTMIAAILMVRAQSGPRVIAAAAIGIGAQALIASYLAFFVRSEVSGAVLHEVSAIVMLAIGVVLAVVGFRHEEEEEEDLPPTRAPLFKLALIFFLAEIGDVTQATTAGFALSFGQPLLVALAATAGMTGAISVGVTVGKAAERIPRRWLYLAAGGVLVVLGALALAGVPVP